MESSRPTRQPGLILLDREHLPAQASVVLANLFSPRGSGRPLAGEPEPDRSSIALRASGTSRGLPTVRFAMPLGRRNTGMQRRTADDSRHSRIATEPLRKLSSRSPCRRYWGSTRGRTHRDEVLPTITIPGVLTDFYQRPQVLILGLGDPQSVEAEMRRLKLVLEKPDYVRGWIAHTEDDRFDAVRDSTPGRDAQRRSVRRSSRSWLGRDPRSRRADARADARVEAARDRPRLGRRTARPRHPRSHPRRRRQRKAGRRRTGLPPQPKRKGHEGFIRDCLAAAPPDVAEKVRREVLERAEDSIHHFGEETTPDWLRAACDEVKEAQAPRLGQPTTSVPSSPMATS